MEMLNAVLMWIYKARATWYLAAVLGGLAIFIFERGNTPREAPTEDVRRAVDRYQQYYGVEAHRIIGDHMLGASFIPDGQHRRFLERMATEFRASKENRADIIDP